MGSNMGRVVEPERRVYDQTATTGAASRRPGERVISGGDSYLARVAKYIPAEFIGVYVTLENAFKAFDFDAAMARMDQIASMPQISENMLVKGSYIFLLALLTIYSFWRGRREKQPWKLFCLASVASFLVWSYALGGEVFRQYELFNPMLATVITPLFALVIGLFKPVTRDGDEQNIGSVRGN